MSLLHIAAQNNYTEMMEVLVEQGANVNAVDSAGRSALHMACQRSASANAALLLVNHKVCVMGNRRMINYYFFVFYTVAIQLRV